MAIQNKRKSDFFSKTNKGLGARKIAMDLKGIVCVALAVAVFLSVLPVAAFAQYYGYSQPSYSGYYNQPSYSGYYGYSQPSYSGYYNQPSYSGYYGYSQPSYSSYGYSQPSYYSNYGYSGGYYSGYQNQSRAYLDNFLTYYFNSGFPGPR
jgi:hypothetical protein